MRTAFLVMLAFAAGACDLLKGPPPDADVILTRQLNQMQIAMEAGVPDDGTTLASLLAVVDTYAMQPDTGEEEDLEAKEKASQRERVVLQELEKRLIDNRLIVVIPPDKENSDLARTEIVASNVAKLSASSAQQIGEALGVHYLVCAVIDLNRAEVNVVVQEVPGGEVVFRDTLKDWGAVFAAPEVSAE